VLFDLLPTQTTHAFSTPRAGKRVNFQKKNRRPDGLCNLPFRNGV
jgi:hypothetical protein